MSYTAVRNYTDKELLKQVSDLDGFVNFPSKRWIIAVRSLEDTPNVYDDKFYIMHGKRCIDVLTGTTNAGTPSLLGGYKKYNSKGSAIISTGQICYNAFSFGYHNGRMPALRQIKPIKYYRDNNNDNKVDEVGREFVANYNTNFHANTYNNWGSFKKWIIGNWSHGCLVSNDVRMYKHYMDLFKKNKESGYQKYVTIAIIKES